MIYIRIFMKMFISGLMVSGVSMAQGQIQSAEIKVVDAFSQINLSTVGSESAVPTADEMPPEVVAKPSVNNVIITQSTIDEIRRLISDHKLTEMRTVYNGSYGASLLLDIADDVYYVAIFRKSTLSFWRVVKTGEKARAEAIFQNFSKQTDSLARLELLSVSLEAQKEQTKKKISATNDQVRRLKADIRVATEQQEKINSHQEAMREETAILLNERNALQSQLKKLQRRVRSLAHQSYPELQY